ncbi:MAG: hypothetical protein RSE13_08365 [Planktothrix sp. GU0601_MAG3]|nr:MAG: hypothetical protein RSE13_08365 [Planktothrix sp. GU0601_MAG3]
MTLNLFNSAHLKFQESQFKLKKLIPVFVGLLTLLSILGLGQFQVLGQQQNDITIDFAAQRTGISSVSGFLYGKNATQPPDTIIKPLETQTVAYLPTGIVSASYRTRCPISINFK